MSGSSRGVVTDGDDFLGVALVFVRGVGCVASDLSL